MSLVLLRSGKSATLAENDSTSRKRKTSELSQDDSFVPLKSSASYHDKEKDVSTLLLGNLTSLVEVSSDESRLSQAKQSSLLKSQNLSLAPISNIIPTICSNMSSHNTHHQYTKNPFMNSDDASVNIKRTSLQPQLFPPLTTQLTPLATSSPVKHAATDLKIPALPSGNHTHSTVTLPQFLTYLSATNTNLPNDGASNLTGLPAASKQAQPPHDTLQIKSQISHDDKSHHSMSSHSQNQNQQPSLNQQLAMEALINTNVEASSNLNLGVKTPSTTKPSTFFTPEPTFNSSSSSSSMYENSAGDGMISGSLDMSPNTMNNLIFYQQMQHQQQQNEQFELLKQYQHIIAMQSLMNMNATGVPLQMQQFPLQMQMQLQTQLMLAVAMQQTQMPMNGGGSSSLNNFVNMPNMLTSQLLTTTAAANSNLQNVSSLQFPPSSSTSISTTNNNTNSNISHSQQVQSHVALPSSSSLSQHILNHKKLPPHATTKTTSTTNLIGTGLSRLGGLLDVATAGSHYSHAAATDEDVNSDLSPDYHPHFSTNETNNNNDDNKLLSSYNYNEAYNSSKQTRVDWHVSYAALLEYCKEHGHCNIRQRDNYQCVLKGVGMNGSDYKYDGRLGVWLFTQRQTKKDGKLSKDRDTLLQKLVDEGNLLLILLIIYCA